MCIGSYFLRKKIIQASIYNLNSSATFQYTKKKKSFLVFFRGENKAAGRARVTSKC